MRQPRELLAKKTSIRRTSIKPHIDVFYATPQAPGSGRDLIDLT